MNQTRPAIVVGIDGSPGSEEALRWAAKQAQLTGAELRAISSWQTPSAYGYYVDYSDADAAAEAKRTLEQVISKSLGAPPSVPVVTSVVKGQPAEVLVGASRSADLLVVGSRGRGAFTAMLLGSVSQHCVQHAACTVVVVRRPPEDGHATGR